MSPTSINAFCSALKPLFMLLCMLGLVASTAFGQSSLNVSSVFARTSAISNGTTSVATSHTIFPIGATSEVTLSTGIALPVVRSIASMVNVSAAPATTNSISNSSLPSLKEAVYNAAPNAKISSATICKARKVPSNPNRQMALHREIGYTQDPAVISEALSALPDVPQFDKLGARGIEGSSGSCLRRELTDYQDLDSDLVQLFSVDKALNDPSVPDAVYYEFSEDNQRESEVSAWYVACSATYMRRVVEDPTLEERGEMKQFAIDFAKAYNFECNLRYASCLEKPSLHDLQIMYPEFENRPLIRRIYFQFHMVDILTRKYTSDLSSLDALNLWFQDAALHYVQLYTQQVDGHKMNVCAFLKSIKDQVIQAVVSFGTLGVENKIGELFSPDGPLGNLVFSVHTRNSLELMGEGLNKNGQALLKSMKGNTGFGAGINAAPFMGFSLNFAAPLHGMLEAYVKDANVDRVKNSLMSHFDDMGGQMINGGIAKGIYCNEFEGNWDHYNQENNDRLKGYLRKLFTESRHLITYLYEQMYKGTMHIEGENPTDIPVASYLAKMLAQKKWHGRNGIKWMMDNGVHVENQLKQNLHKELVGGILANGQNFIQCTHFDQAPGACAHAASSHENFERSLFCPKPVEDPALICMAARYYTANHGGHLVPFNGLDSLERDSEFPIHPKQFFQEVYKFYVDFGNNFDFNSRLFVDSITGDTENSQVGRFHMPVCQSDDLMYFENFDKGTSGVLGTGNSYHFPATCGSFHSEETGQFMDQIEMGEYSSLWNYRTPTGQQNGVFRDRIMRNLRYLPPLNRYLAMCSQNIHYPAHGDKGNMFHRKPGQDPECHLVREAVLSMDEREANMAFCRNDMGHSVFKRERNVKLEIPDLPMKWTPNHHKRCAEYLRKPWVSKDKHEK